MRPTPPARLVPAVIIVTLLLIVPVMAASAPLPAFTAVPVSGPVPLKVNFTDLSTRSPTGWAWFFGDETYKQPWTNLTGNPPWPAREWHTTVALPNGALVLMGGSDENENIWNDTWYSSDKGATWMNLTGSPKWLAREQHSSVALPDNSIMLMGGYDDYSHTNDTWRSYDYGVTWNLVGMTNAQWSARSGHSSVAQHDGTIVLTGGFATDDSHGTHNGPKNDTWKLFYNTATWMRVNASSGWVPRDGHSMVALPDGSIVLMGGIYSDNDAHIYSYLNDTWRSTDEGSTWIRMNASSGWMPRSNFGAVAMPDGSIVLMGGRNASAYMHDVWRSADNGATWAPVNLSAGWTERERMTAVGLPDGSIVLTGGCDLGGDKNDTWRFVPVGSSIRNLSHTYTRPGIYHVSLQAYSANGYNSIQKPGLITVTGATPSGIGVFRNTSHTFLLKNGSATTTVIFGKNTDLPVTGDWNGDGIGDVGVFRPLTHTFLLKNGSATTTVIFGQSTDLPVTGDWNGDGLGDVGVFRKSIHTFILKNGSATTRISLGQGTDLPVTGDWNSDGLTDVGVFRPATYKFILKNGTATTTVSWGVSTDLPVTGDWNGDGLYDIGVFRNTSHTFILKNGTEKTKILWGQNTDLPVSGKWS
jgi:PKD repeat protein